MYKHKGILSIDFDNTLAIVENFPHINGLRPGAKKYVNKLYDEGYYIQIWTCRTDKKGECNDMTKAKEFLTQEGVKFHKINENHPALTEAFKSDSRKLSADLYIDDKGLWPLGIPSWFTLYWLIKIRLFWDDKRALDYCKEEHFKVSPQTCKY